MSLDVVELRAFYAQSLGQATRAQLNSVIRSHFKAVHGMSIAGLGYPTPYLGLFREEAYRSIALMPAQQGVMHWPTARPAKATLVDETALPLPDASMDRMLVVHMLEHTAHPQDMLGEVWRVLAAGGRALVVVPNRRGLWAQRDNNPFGHGRPYSKQQLTELMREVAFTPVAWSEALWMPPFQAGWLLNMAPHLERLGRAMPMPLAGVHVVEAIKQVYKPVALRKTQSNMVFTPALSGAASMRGTHSG